MNNIIKSDLPRTLCHLVLAILLVGMSQLEVEAVSSRVKQIGHLDVSSDKIMPLKKSAIRKAVARSGNGIAGTIMCNEVSEEFYTEYTGIYLNDNYVWSWQSPDSIIYEENQTVLNYSTVNTCFYFRSYNDSPVLEAIKIHLDPTKTNNASVRAVFADVESGSLYYSDTQIVADYANNIIYWKPDTKYDQDNIFFYIESGELNIIGFDIYSEGNTPADFLSNSNVSVVSSPVFRPESCSFATPISVEILAEDGCNVYYRTDGYAPTVDEQYRYNGPIVISATTTFMAIAADANGNTSRIVTSKYTCTRHGIGEDYNPASPGNPGTGTGETQEKTYKLTVVTNPSGAGSAYANSYELKAGVQTRVYTYNNTGFDFLNWTIEGEVVSKSTSFYYVMPEYDVTIIANYSYNPASPGNPSPEEQKVKHPVVVRAIPSGAASLSPSGAFDMEENASRQIYAYPKTGWHLTGWTINGEKLQSTTSPISITMGEKALDIAAYFSYNPSSPSNPGANYYNPTTGQVIVDDFTPGYLYDALSNLVGYDNFSNISSLIVKGEVTSNDLGNLYYFSNAGTIDISRTGGVSELPGYTFSSVGASSIILPSTISSIGNYVFRYCENLASLTVYAQEPPMCNSYTFSGFTNKANCTVYVPASAIELYSNADYWKDFTILPIINDAHVLQVNLPADASDGRYKNNSLEIVNINSGVRQKYVISDRLLYTFNGLQKDEQYNIYMFSQAGLEIGRIENVVIPDQDIEVTFDNLKSLHTVYAKVLASDGTDVTNQVGVEWLKPLADGTVTYLRKAVSLGEIPEGQQLICRVSLDNKLGVVYTNTEDVEFTVGSDNNTCIVNLIPFRAIELSGSVVDGEGTALSGVSVSVNQTLNGKYSKTYTAKTDRKGQWNLSVLDAPETRLTYAASECVNVNDTIGAFAADVNALDLGKTTMKSIVGARVSYGLTYHAAGSEDVQDYYSDYQNVAISVFNVTQNRAHKEVSLQYPILAVLDENINAGDELKLTATSKTGAFNPIVETVTVGDNQRAEVTFDIVGKGGISASFEMTENPAVIAMLYTGKGELLKKMTYSEAKATFTELEDGDYTLVSMGQSDLMNSILRLSNFAEIGLTEGKDYVKNSVKVETGKLAEVKISEVPAFDESLFYYTNSTTSFSSNKSSITTGNYLTLRSAIDFKGVYKNDISNVALIVDLPEACDFVEQSVIQGPNLLPYTLDNNRLTVQLGNNYQSQTRFCVIPKYGGIHNITAAVSFEYAGKVIYQPIGSAIASVSDLAIIAPVTVSQYNFVVRGDAPAFAKVSIYNGDTSIGSGVANGKGEYKVQCELNDPLPYIAYPIYANITTQENVSISSSYTTVTYNPNNTKVLSVSMVSPTSIKFDFENPTDPGYYTFVPSNNQFTFVTKFSPESIDKVKGVNLVVKTLENNYYTLPAIYDRNADIWISTAHFGDEGSLSDVPVNVLVDYITLPDETIDISKAEMVQLDDLACGAEMLRDKIETITTEPKFIIDEDDRLSFIINPIDEEESLIVDIRVVDYQEAKQKLSETQYTFCKTDNGYYCYHESLTEEGIFVSIIDTGEKYAMELTVNTENASQTKAMRAPSVNGKALHAALKLLRSEFKQGFKAAMNNYGLVGDVGGFILDLAGISKYCQVPVFSTWCDMLDNYIDADLQWRDVISKSLYVKCSNGDYRLTSDQMLNFIKQREQIESEADNFHNDYFSYLGLYKERILWSLGYDLTIGLATKGIGKAFEGLSKGGKFIKNSKNATYWKYHIPIKNSNTQRREALGNALKFCAESWFAALSNTIETIVNPEFTDFTSIGDKFNTWGPLKNSEISQKYIDLNNKIKKSYSDCKKKEKEKEKTDKPKKEFPNKDSEVSIDPSGYVYEAIPKNRVEGVQASIYYKETKEDMYGDPYEEVILWNAEKYAQKNPLFTDENGMYRWDVPQGLWQVKFEKDGYQTAYSEWLPVPPPQLDVNIGIVQNKQPEVTEARAYEEGVEVQFDKFMDLSTLTTNNIYVTANGEKLNGEILFVDSELADEYASEDDADAVRYASRVRFVPEEKLSATTGEIRVTVSRNVLSYAGIPMTETFSQVLDVEKEVQVVYADDVKVLYGGEKEVTVYAMPYEAAIGRKLHIANSSDLIASIDITETTLDEEGKAVVTVKGDLPGRAQLTFTIDDVTATGVCAVDVVTEIITAEAPKSSRASGTAVYRGTKVELTSESKNATIYFTTDGSCPCDENGTRRKYTVPIIINEDTRILAMTSVGNGDDDVSETVEFNYTLKRSDMDFQMDEGWTWISHNFESAIAPADLSADEGISRIMGQTQEVIRDPQLGMVGTLAELKASESYKVETTTATARQRLSDVAWNPATPISLNAGWNWLGYPVSQTMSVDEAFATTNAETLDVVVGQNGFAQYDGESWVGSLETMSPGMGFMYQSQSAKNVVYNTSIVSTASAKYAAGISKNLPLVLDIHKYGTIMPVVATINNSDGSALDNDDYQVAAFCGSECRGIGRVVKGLVMMNVYGNGNDAITFHVTDADGENSFDNNASLNFSETVVGDVFNPYAITINNQTGIADVKYEGNIKVTVDGDMLRIKGIPADNINLVEVYDINGQKLIRETHVSESGIRISNLTTGVYVVIVNGNGEYTYHKIAVR